MDPSKNKANSKGLEKALPARRMEIASILASAIMRRRLRDVHKCLKNNRKTEMGLEVLSGKSVHPLEPEHEGERH